MKIKHGMILAAGFGKRMQPITSITPKPLIQIGNKNLLDRAIELLINHGVEEITINVHHLANQIIDFIDAKNRSLAHYSSIVICPIRWMAVFNSSIKTTLDVVAYARKAGFAYTVNGRKSHRYPRC